MPVLKTESYYIISKVEVKDGSTNTTWQKDNVLDENFLSEYVQIQKMKNVLST